MSAPALQGDGAALVPPADELAERVRPAVVPIHVALAAVMADVRSLAKRDRNSHFNFMFRGIDATINALGPAMRTHGVVVLPEVLDVSYRDVRTSKDKPAREVTVKVRYRFIGPDGTSLDVVTPGESMDEGDKGTAKAMSVAMRIALLQTFALPTDDPDPDASDVQRGSGQESRHDETEQPSGPSPRALALAAAGLARRMLDADGDALKRMWTEVFESPARDVDVSGHLVEHRAVLGVRDGEVIPLIALRARVAAHMEKHQRPVTDPTPIGAGDPAEAPSRPDLTEPTEQP